MALGIELAFLGFIGRVPTTELQPHPWMFFSIVLPNMYCCKILKIHKTPLNSSLCKLPAILEPDTSNHFNEPQQTAHVETAVSTICKSCLRVAPTPERLSLYDCFIIYSSFEIQFLSTLTDAIHVNAETDIYGKG